MCRELLEETALTVEPEGILGIWPDVYPYGGEELHTLNIVYWATAPAGAIANAADDASEIGWFTAKTLPVPEEFAFESGIAATEHWRAEHSQRR
ncbi:MAG: hypothetical protein H0T73_06285 [Ardenticatenales bacterium]|nr:hypothetical protein [Ardenticatenales bacterium]